eukprot:3283881-Prymnesium_polylepis.1
MSRVCGSMVAISWTRSCTSLNRSKSNNITSIFGRRVRWVWNVDFIQPELGKTWVDGYWATYHFQPVNLQDLSLHPEAPQKFKDVVANGGQLVIRKIDVNGSRSNGVINQKNKWPVFTALDMPEPFDGTVEEGTHYYVVTENGFQEGGWHGTKWYRYGM